MGGEGWCSTCTSQEITPARRVKERSSSHERAGEGAREESRMTGLTSHAILSFPWLFRFGVGGISVTPAIDSFINNNRGSREVSF